MTNQMKPLGTMSTDEIRAELDGELMRSLALVAALDLLIRERPARQS